MSSLPTPTILICDDEPNLRELMRVTLGERYWCIEADDVAQSIELAQRLRPDLVLVDVMMPGGSGHDRAPGGRRMRDALVAEAAESYVIDAGVGEDREILRASVADLEVSVAEVADAMEADLETLVASIEDRIMARVSTTNGGSSAPFHGAVRRGVSAGVRDALARLRSQAELPVPGELPPDLIELARLYAYSPELRSGLDSFAAASLAGQEEFWDHFQSVTERTLADPGHCWEVLKTVRVRLRGHPARLTELFRRACEHELARGTDIEDFRLRAALRALEGHWVDPGELGYDLAGHHVAVVADTSRSLDAMARLINRQLLWVEGADGWIWGWLGGRTRMSDGLLDALIASQGASDARVVFGEPAEGLTGFAASHHQALEASAIAVATNKRAVRFADCRVLIAVLRDRDLAKAFIDHELGELTRPTEQMCELRNTLRAYLEHSQSISATAANARSGPRND